MGGINSTLSEMSTLMLYKAARDGDNDAVVAAIANGDDVNWKYDRNVSDHISSYDNHDCSVDFRSHYSLYHAYVQSTVVDT